MSDETGDGLDGPEAGAAKRGARSRWRVLAAAGATLVVLAALTVLALTAGSDGSPGSAQEPGRAGTESPEATTTPTIAGPTPPEVAPALTLGRADAPVTIVEFGDYQCPNCGKFARDIKPRLIREYVETGTVRLVWRDFPYFGEQSVHAAVAARAAGRQGKFWAYHDALYANQAPPRSGRLTSERLRGLARDLGLDMARFDADRRDPKLRKAVQRDFAFGQGLGLPGTPAFLIGGLPLFGAQPYAEFERAIERARADQ